MKNDPEYEQWVLDSVRSGFNSRDPWSGMCGPKYVVLSYGSQKEQSRGKAGVWAAAGTSCSIRKQKTAFGNNVHSAEKNWPDSMKH